MCIFKIKIRNKDNKERNVTVLLKIFHTNLNKCETATKRNTKGEKA